MELNGLGFCYPLVSVLHQNHEPGRLGNWDMANGSSLDGGFRMVGNGSVFDIPYYV